MILNAYAVLDMFLSLLRLGLGVLVFGLGFCAWRTWLRDTSAPDSRKALEDRCYLLFLLAGLLLVLNIASWPLFYLLLQSYVPQWPGVMCIYGVTRIGAGSVGTSRFLPSLVSALQGMKPALVFLSGAWLVLHLINRRTHTAPLTGRVLVLLLAVGLLAATDAAAEIAYLVIPKKEEFPSGGCCTEAFDAETRASRFLPGALTEENELPYLYALYYAVNAGVIAGLVGVRFRSHVLPGRRLALLLAGVVLAVVVNTVFLIEVAAPRLLGLPYHHCPYDLLPAAPESLLAVALFLTGSAAVGWACVARWWGNHPEAGDFLPGTIDRLLHLGLVGYLGSVVMLSVELALATP
jgi:hypothetical protein